MPAPALHGDLLAVHGLVVKKAGSAAAVAAILGVSEDDVVEALTAARDAGHVVEAKGLYMVTPSGRARLVQEYPNACARLRASVQFSDAYERFEVFNRALLDLFTRWQTLKVGGVVVANDHHDRSYDRRIIDELGDVHEDVAPVLEAFAVVEPRFSSYWDRLELAYDRVLAGDGEWITGTKLDSYHTVWFELHDDILRLLGRARMDA